MASLDDDELLALLRSETETALPAQQAQQPVEALLSVRRQQHASPEDDDLQLLLNAADPLPAEASCHQMEPLATTAPSRAGLAGSTERQDIFRRSGATTAQLGSVAATGDSALAGNSQPQCDVKQQQQQQQQQPHEQPAKQPEPEEDVMDEWDPMEDLDMYLEEQQQEQEQQQAQPGHRHQAQASSKVSAAAAAPARLLPDDELADLMMDLEDMQAAQGRPSGSTGAAGTEAAPGAAAGPVKPAAALPADLGVDILDLGAELDFYDEMQAQMEQQEQQQQGHGNAPPLAKRPRHGAEDLDMDLDLDAGSGGEEHRAQQQQQQARLLHKPGTISSLTGGKSKAGIAQAAAAALAAAEAACPPKKTLLGVGLGRALPVTAQDGTRAYCSVSKPSLAPAQGALTVMGSSSRWGKRPLGCLLAQPVTAMIQTLDARRREAVVAQLAEAHAVAARMEAVVEGTMELDELNVQQGPAAAAAAAAAPATQLWVDKYAPKRFSGLLSEGWINREVANWMLSWHPDYRQQQQQRQQEQQQAGGAAAGVNRWQQGGQLKRKRGGWRQGFGDDMPAPVLLLSGTPGAGKTTLAHVVAHHCRFRPVEINASDERTASTLVRRVEDAAQMRALLDKAQRPNCIILDEVDGATGGSEGHSAVAALVALVMRGRDKPGGKAAAEGGKKKRKKGSQSPLNCPVVCICNDLYAPALRPLREVSRILTVKAPGPDRLVPRLATICAAEGVAVDKTSLELLCERTCNDVRACINTLQLLARQQQQQQLRASGTNTGRPSATAAAAGTGQRVTISRAQVSNTSTGQKDLTLSSLGVLKQLLQQEERYQLGKLKQQLMQAVASSSSSTAGRSRAGGGAGGRGWRDPQQQLYDELLNLGDHDLMLSGLSENLLQLEMLDVDMSRTAALTEQLAIADMLMVGGSSGGAGGLGAYRHYVPACLLLAKEQAVAEGGAQQVVWPRSQLEAHRAAVSSGALLRSWVCAAPPAAARTLACRPALLESAPAVKMMLHLQTVRNMVPRLMSADEAAAVAHQVQLLVGCGLNYSFPKEDHERPQPSRAAAADEQQQLPRPAPVTPAIDTLHCYQHLPSSSKWTEMPLVLRQLIAREVVADKLRRANAVGGKGQAADDKENLLGKALSSSRTLGKTATGEVLKAKAGTAAPRPPAAPRGCWLDQLKAAQASTRRRALIQGPVGNKAGGKAAKTAPGTAAAAAGATISSSQAMEEDAIAEHIPSSAGHLVLYQFQEGYTVAVKRPVKMSELL